MTVIGSPSLPETGPPEPPPAPGEDGTRILGAAELEAELEAAAPSDAPVLAAEAPTIMTASPLATAAPSTTLPPSVRRGRQEGTLAPGQLLGHTYEIEALLARGGMGEVYRARHAELGSLHAIKVILPELAEEPRIISLFQEEARKLRRLRHDAIVAYEGLFRDESGMRYLVMEFVDGPSLAQVLKRHPLSVDEVRRLRDRCGAGLAAAHDKGIYHRDISPDNIILVDGKTELSKIIDFGIAKSTDPGDRTVVGRDFAGKYSYVSPEQLGLYNGAVDGRSDIYSLGLVLVAAARGRALDMGDSPMSVLEARRSVPDLAGVPEELRPEIAPLLEPDPARRPASMRALPGASIEAGGMTQLQTTLAPQPVIGRSSPGRGRWILAGLAAVALVAGGGYLSLPYLRATPAIVVPPDKIVVPPVVTPAMVLARIQPALAGYDCASLKAEVSDTLQASIRGFVGNGGDLSRLRQAVAGLAPGGVATDGVASYVWPHCAVAALLEADAGGGAAPAIAFNLPDAAYHDGQQLVLGLTVPADRDGFLTVDYYDSGGSVVHIYPEAAAPTGKVTRGQRLSLGNDGKTPGSREPLYTVGTPYGPNMIVAVLTAHALFNPARAQQEDAKAYLEAFKRALDRAVTDGGRENVTASYKFFDALP